MKPHRARILAMQAIYQLDFNPRPLEKVIQFDWIDYELPEDERKLAAKLIFGVNENEEMIDNIIKKYSQNWDFERVSVVTKAILRISIYQLAFMEKEIPQKVTLDEGIRLSKEYAETDSHRYINGILDTVYKELLIGNISINKMSL